MFSKNLGVLLVLAGLPAWAQVSSGPDAMPSTTAVIVPRQHAPRKIAGLQPDRMVDNVTVSDSTSWAGYVVTGTSFTSAKGSWIVPTVKCTETPNTYSAFWVGIDGWSSDTVEQTGMLAECDGTTALYYAWYEFYPAASVDITSVPVAPGNVIAAAVSYSGSTFTITITNETTGKSFSKSGKVSGAARSSAEWIAGGMPPADFGTVDFGEDFTDVSGTNYATDSTNSGPIGSFGNNVYRVNLVTSSGTPVFVTSPLTADGTSFSVTWELDLGIEER